MDVVVRRLSAEEVDAEVGELGAVLFDCVDGGASIGFMADLTYDEAREWFRGLVPEVASGARRLLAAYDEDGLVGTVQFVHAWPPNQPHRADVTKLLVHRRARGRGLGRLLMERLEDEARADGKTLLVLDAVTGGDAYRLYKRLGWVDVGDVPDFALYPDGRPCSTTFFYKNL